MRLKYNGHEVTVEIEYDGIDSFFAYGTDEEGTELTEQVLQELQDLYQEELNEAVFEHACGEAEYKWEGDR